MRSSTTTASDEGLSGGTSRRHGHLRRQWRRFRQRRPLTGSSTAPRRFAVEVTELAPSTVSTVCGVTVRAWEADHSSGAPALLLRLDLAGKSIAYTGDTAWTDAITEAAAEADLLIAEAYYRDKNIPYHLRLADIQAHQDQLTARRIVLTHMSADMLAARHETALDQAYDGLTISIERPKTPNASK